MAIEIYIYGGLVLKLIIDFIEDKITPSDFLNAFYEDEELQAALEEEKDSVRNLNDYSLCHCILEANASDLGSILNIKYAIKSYLEKEGISFSYSDKTEKNHNIFLTALPRWLNAPSDYFSQILDNNALSKAEKKEQIKAQVKKDFRCLKKPPQWIQDCDWPISNGKPLVYVGQLELNIDTFHDKGAVYVFLNADTGEIETIKQFY